MEDRENKLDPCSILYILKYLYSNINYAGKVQRAEDQRKLLAVLEDLFTPEIYNCASTGQDLSRSHYGLPLEYEDYMAFCHSLPK
mmetsp:Transcript_79491/g.110064  ORF Transcript_79491/g.110064 Transcript_79491/m.110064 type:complete len:85 (+) Transcript_79491:1721-1975(+)